jgi:hypothetical protein
MIQDDVQANHGIACPEAARTSHSPPLDFKRSDAAWMICHRKCCNQALAGSDGIVVYTHCCPTFSSCVSAPRWMDGSDLLPNTYSSSTRHVFLVLYKVDTTESLSMYFIILFAQTFFFRVSRTLRCMIGSLSLSSGVPTAKSLLWMSSLLLVVTS